jgi:predicted metal-binding membrane protein
MMYDGQEVAQVRNPMLIVSAVAWGLLLGDPGGAVMSTHDPAAHSVTMAPASLHTLLAIHPPASLAAGWVLMLVAMMLPLLISPVSHLRLRSFAYRRARAITLFVAAYAAIWIVLGGALVAVALAATLFAPQSYLPAAGAALIALVWQSSPAKQRCLNRCHAHPELAAFGVAADIDALRFGTAHGISCAGSCWALMLCPMLVPSGQHVAMVAAAVVVFSERLEGPRPPSWRLRGLGKALRIVAAQARIRVKAVA